MIPGMIVTWTTWNLAHITKHGGSQDMAEQMANEFHHTLRLRTVTIGIMVGIIDGRSWTMILGVEPAGSDKPTTIYPITMYPTRRGGRRHRRQEITQ